MKRRDFLKAGLASTAGLMLPIGDRAWAVRAGAQGPRLAVVFLRGAVDGLNVVTPYAEDEYYEYRPTIALPRPGEGDGLLDLDGHFGLHPALEAVLPLWKKKELAFVHACGSPDPNRSHFEAQDYMETATPGVPGTRNGWMNRLAGALHLAHAEDTVAFGSTEPLITRGAAATTTFPTGRGASRTMPMDRDPVQLAFDALYRKDRRLGRVYSEAVRSRAALRSALEQDMGSASQGAPDAKGFSGDALRAARMMVADPSIRLVFFQLGGWDTHINEGATHGQLANHLKPLGDGLAAFREALGPTWRETVVLVVSEFGRTAHENGNRGTDHGHGNVHWVLGGAVRGGRVYGDWRGLADDALYQHRDVPVTTDFRSVIDIILAHHLGLRGHARATVLPGFMPSRKGIAGIII